MKQNITPEQLNELSDKGIEGLRKWLSKKYGYDVMNKDHTKWLESLLLSIGQMIEFLDENDFLELIDYWGANIGGYQNKWRVECKDSQFNDNELCDALWEAVKEVLEK